MNAYYQIAIQALMPAAAALVFLVLEKYTIVKEQLEPEVRQLVYGIVFGIIAVYGTEKGIPYNGAVVNARDAAVVTAGLLFGAPAGIIAGLIGGIERWVAVAWGVGTYTRVACTVSTIIAGFYSGLVRKFLFNNKKPSWGIAFAIGLVMEVFHMVMVFITNMSDATRAAEVVKVCSVIMVPANSLGVAVSSFVDWLITHKKKVKGEHVLPTISDIIQRWLLASVVVVFLLTSFFMYQLQTSIAEKQAEDYLTLAISDAVSTVRSESDINMINVCYKVKGLQDKKSVNEIADDLELTEICIVDKNGIIVDSNVPSYIGFNMNDGEQSREFLCLLADETEYTQEYGPTSYDKNVYRKYAGVKTSTGFLQIAYDSATFQKDISSQIKGISSNRHVGNTGYIVVADSNRWVVSEPDNVSISRLDDIGFNRNNINKVFKANINGVDSLCYCVNTEGYYVLSVMPTEEAYSLRDTAIYSNTFMEILVFALLFTMVYLLIKKVIVDKVDIVNFSLNKITNGDLNEIVKGDYTNEFNSLSNDINATVDTLKRYIAEASARIDAELEYAKNIQNSALPHVFPKNEHFEMYALMDAAKEVGGDFYDFSRINKEKFNFLVADVSGKGIPGAMFMMRAKSVLSSFTEMELGVNEVFTNGNDRLCEGNDAGMFVTAWEASLDLKSGHIDYANAGHNPPVIRRADGTVEFIKGKPGFVLAGMEGIQYKIQEVDLKPGDIIFLYTDGVVEATSAYKELYGDDRLLQAMSRVSTDNMENLCNEILDDVNKFVGDAEQFDDITMLALKYLG